MPRGRRPKGIGEPFLDALARSGPDAVLDALCAQQLRGSDRRVTAKSDDDSTDPGRTALALSTWNYRVVRQQHGDEVLYGIHEVYYDDTYGTGWTVEPVAPVAESVEELRDVLAKMATAPDSEVIDDPVDR